MKVPAKVKKVLITAFRLLIGEAWEIALQLLNDFAPRLRIKKLSAFLQRRIRPCFRWGVWVLMVYSVIRSGEIPEVGVEADAVWKAKSMLQPIGQIIKGILLQLLPSSVQLLMKKLDKSSLWFGKLRKIGGKLVNLFEKISSS